MKYVVTELGEVFSVEEESEKIIQRILQRQAQEIKFYSCDVADCENCENYHATVEGVCDCILDPHVKKNPRFCYCFEKYR